MISQQASATRSDSLPGNVGQDEKKPGEVRTLIVVLLTTATMVLEFVAGIVYGSMALLFNPYRLPSTRHYSLRLLAW
jgi:Co/Zn/Cd efflux system component